MTSIDEKTAETTAPPVKKPASRGQWAVDGRDPLNANEVFKQADNGLNVRQRIIDIYSKQGFDSIPHDDLHGRMRWWGLYTQRKQGLDAQQTSKLEADELSDKYFMMRIRTDGGALTTEQLRTIAGISRDFARGTADISDRQNIQLHWIEVENVPEIWNRLDAVGLDSVEACGDTPRVILGSPVAGIAADEIIDPSPVINEIKRRYIGSPKYSNLPRKFKSAITGHPSLDVVHEINDISLVGVVHPELGPGFDLWVGGGLSITPRLAERLGVFVSEADAPEVWEGVVSIFRDYGFRKQRTKARLKFLLAEWGTEKFRQVLEDEYLFRKLPDGPAATPDRAAGAYDHVGVHDQKDGRKFVGFAPTVGRVNADVLFRVADEAEAVGSHRVRLTPHQKILVLDVYKTKVNKLVKALAEVGLQANPSPFRRATMACTGIEYCKLAFVETKGLAARTVDEIEQRLAAVPIEPPITLNINGCPNACARFQVADIGLKGQIVGGEFGFQVHLGGGLASQDREEGGLGRTVRGLKVTADDLPNYVERVTRTFLDQRTNNANGNPETFSEWVRRAEEDDLK